jgi:hypothetical protein
MEVTKSWYPHYFNSEENLDYLGPNPTYYGVYEMSGGERTEFLVRYER